MRKKLIAGGVAVFIFFVFTHTAYCVDISLVKTSLLDKEKELLQVRENYPVNEPSTSEQNPLNSSNDTTVLKQEMQKLENAAHEYESSFRAILAQLKSAQLKNLEYEEEIKRLKQKMEAVEAGYSVLKRKEQDDSKVSKSKLADYDNLIARLEKRAQSLQVAYDLLNQERLSCVQKIEEFKKRLIQEGASLECVEKELNSSQERGKEYEAQRDSLIEEMRALQVKLEVLTQENETNREQLRQMEEMKFQNKEYEKTIHTLEKRVQALQVGYDILQKEKGEHLTEISEFQKKLSQRKESLQDSLAELRETKLQSEEYQELVSRLEKRIKSLQVGFDILHKDKASRASQIGEFEEEIQQYETLLEKAQTPSGVNKKGILYKVLGYLYLRENNYPKAIEYYQKVLEITPGDKDTNYNLGYLFVKAGQYTQAIKYYKNSLSQDASDKDVYHNLSVIYTRYLNNKKEGKRYYNKYLQYK